MIKREDLIEITVTQEMIDKTQLLLETEYVCNEMSVLSGAGNFSGKLAEVVYQYYFPEAIRKNTKHYDFIHNGYKVDIKSKTGNYIPNVLTNSVNVHTYSLEHQKCEFYVFMSVHNSFSKVWIIGGCSKQFFRDNSIMFPKGTIMSNTGYELYRDTNMLEISKLTPISKR